MEIEIEYGPQGHLVKASKIEPNTEEIRNACRTVISAFETFIEIFREERKERIGINFLMRVIKCFARRTRFHPIDS